MKNDKLFAVAALAEIVLLSKNKKWVREYE